MLGREFRFGFRGITIAVACLALHSAFALTVAAPWVDPLGGLLVLVALTGWTFPVQFAVILGGHLLGVRERRIAAALLAPGPLLWIAIAIVAWLTPDPPNQQLRSVSPDGGEVLEVTIEERNLTRMPMRYWVLRIYSQEGELLYEGTDWRLGGRWSAYWGWDDEGRVWMYHSDAGHQFYVEEGPDGWRAHDDENGPPYIPEYVLPW